jgi:hypothetical protein
VLRSARRGPTLRQLQVSLSRLPAIRGSRRQESKDNSRGQRLAYTLALKLQTLSLHSHFRDIAFYGTNQSSKSREDVRNDGKNFLVIVSPKDLTNEAKLQKAEARAANR